MADLSDWNPFAGLQILRRALFGEEDDPLGGSVNPTTDVYTRNDKIVIEVQIPGYNREEIDLDVDGVELTISAYHRKPQDEAGKKYIARESSSSFQRRITLPDGADMEKIQASLLNGILTVTVPTPVVKSSKMKIAIVADDLVEDNPRALAAAPTLPETPGGAAKGFPAVTADTVAEASADNKSEAAKSGAKRDVAKDTAKDASKDAATPAVTNASDKAATTTSAATNAAKTADAKTADAKTADAKTADVAKAANATATAKPAGIVGTQVTKSTTNNTK